MIHRPVGDRAVLIEVDGTRRAAGLAAALRRAPLDGQVDVVAGARTVLVRFAWRVPDLSTVDVEGEEAERGREHPVEVVYDGPDLAEVARLTGLAEDEVVRAHTATPWLVAFAGFAPGFGYLTGGDPRLRVPRRDTARRTVPAGSVALAGEYSAVYPGASPGGWQLIGRTGTPMWDPARAEPAMLAPGDRVRFHAVRAVAEIPTGAPRPVPPGGPPGLRVLDPGGLALVQDLGRAGHAGSGVSTSGAMDRAALRAANRLVGNDIGAAAIEVATGGLTVVADGELVVAVTGARRSLPGNDFGVPLRLGDGQELVLGAASGGVRGYLAVRGGLAVTPTMGSRSTDTLSGLGPPPLRAGDYLPVGGASGSVQVAASPPSPVRDILDVVLGPRADWFTDDAVAVLLDHPWRVGEPNRVGLRLSGPALRRARDGELPSEGVVRGAIQVPPDGQPVLFAADHPVTGGYPVIAVVVQAHLDALAQLAAGTEVRFRRAGADSSDR